MKLDDVGDEVERLRKENEALKRKVTALEVAKDGAVGEGRNRQTSRIDRVERLPFHHSRRRASPIIYLSSSVQRTLSAFSLTFFCCIVVFAMA